MPKKMIKPGPDLLTQVNRAFLDNGYSGLSMVALAKVCDSRNGPCIITSTTRKTPSAR